MMKNTDKFSSKAQHYVHGRPGYPKQAVDYMKTLAPDDAVFADIGAGTGKLTITIAEAGYEIFAVEPNVDMYEQLKKILKYFPNTIPIYATSEETTLADNSVDVITVAQALHWFDLEKFDAECRRILKPNGWVVVLYNNGVKGDAKVKEKVAHRMEATQKFFKDPIVKDFDHVIHYTRESWYAFMMSHSHSPLPDDENYDDYIRKITDIFDEESVDEIMVRKLITTVYAQQFK